MKTVLAGLDARCCAIDCMQCVIGIDAARGWLDARVALKGASAIKFHPS